MDLCHFVLIVCTYVVTFVFFDVLNVFIAFKMLWMFSWKDLSLIFFFSIQLQYQNVKVSYRRPLMVMNPTEKKIQSIFRMFRTFYLCKYIYKRAFASKFNCSFLSSEGCHQMVVLLWSFGIDCHLIIALGWNSSLECQIYWH